jgi:CxxC-x17-CxxC domain-containing protein
MKNYSRDNRTERVRGSRRGGSKNSGKSLMHQATCDNCGRECEVPFKPTSGKPVYCSSCFEKNQNEDPRRSGRERSFRKSTGRDFKERGFGGKNSDRPVMHDAVCDKCGEECEVPFRPTKGKPIYCDKCFDSSSSNREKGTEQLKKELGIINKKLDKILEALMPVLSIKKEQEEVEEETEDEKPRKKTKKTAVSKDAAKKKVSAKKITKKTKKEV